MHGAIFCIECGNLIATTDGTELRIQHRGRIIYLHGSASIQCEKCGRVTKIDTENLRRLCGDDTTMFTCEKGDARCV